MGTVPRHSEIRSDRTWAITGYRTFTPEFVSPDIRQPAQEQPSNIPCLHTSCVRHVSAVIRIGPLSANDAETMAW